MAGGENKNQTSLKMIEVGKQKILNADIKEIGKAFIEDMFASYYDKESGEKHESSFNATDPITLTHSEYPSVKDSVDTTLGRLIFNRYVLEGSGLLNLVPYWNIPLSSKGLNQLNVLVNNLCINDKINTETLGLYVDRRDWFGFWTCAFNGVSLTKSLLHPMENVHKRKAELFEEHAEVLKNGSPVDQVMTENMIEKELLEMARKNLENDPGYDLYASGVNNFDNNFKTIAVMANPVFNNVTGRYDVVQKSYIEGIEKKDITAFGNSVVAAAYPSAVGTRDAGYMSKIILALLQSEHIDPDPDSDCGTQATIPFTITKKNKMYVLFRYIKSGKKPTLITLDNVDSFVGQTVQMYSPQGCTHDAICGKCGGRVFHNLGVTRIGMLTTQITQKMLNIKLKSKHNLSQSAGVIPENYVFLDKNDFFKINEQHNLVNTRTMKMFIPKIFGEGDADGEKAPANGFYFEATHMQAFGVFPVKFYDKDGNEILSTMLIVPAVLRFNLYDDVQEDADNYIVTYEPNSEVCLLSIQKVLPNVEFYINQIYLYSRKAQIPYNLMTDIMFRCLEINSIDLTGPSIIYELLARRVCRTGNNTFAKTYGANPGVNQMSYEKLPFRKAVQKAGVLQGVLFQSVSESINTGLAQTLRGVEPEDTPLEKIIKA